MDSTGSVVADRDETAMKKISIVTDRHKLLQLKQEKAQFRVFH
jgi:hypothetical protein